MDRLSDDGIKTVLHPVHDLAKPKPVYTALLGVERWRTRPTTSAYEPKASRSG